ncbi:MAG TPA: NAD(P)-binding domain-containing protein [Polyangiaceae bacterium]|nr:NAD(P)-binding domain-containing protein [Polyangiaceae bacterium]
MTSSFALGSVVLLSFVLFWWWGRSDKKKEQVATRIAEDIKAMGDVVATSLSPRIDPAICIGSGACVSACPEKGVIALVRGQAELINPLGCIGHGACANACPVQAIQLVYGTKKRGVELPVVDEHFETNRRGVYIAGELGGMGLIRNAVVQGREAMEHIIAGGADGPRRGTNDAFDVIVVGAGPAGISATLRAMQEGLRALLIDREGFGGTILHYPRAKVVMTGVLELPMFGKVPGRQLSKEQLVGLWQEVRTKYAPPLVTGELVTRLEPRIDGMWGVVTDRGVRHAANVILALGGRGSPQKLGVPGEERSKVAYRLLEPEEFAGRHVLVVGGGNSAVESALALADSGRCASVAISYRRSEFARCRAENRRRIDGLVAQRRVRVYFGTELGGIGERDVALRSGDGFTGTIANDAVIVQIGGTAPAKLLGSLGIALTTKYGER